MTGGSYIIRRISEQATETPKKPVFAEHLADGRLNTISYLRYEEESSKLASVLKQLGIQPGDIVASYMPNGYNINLLDLALMKAGAVHAAFFPNYGRTELGQVIPYCNPKMIVCAPGLFMSNVIKILPGISAGIIATCMGANSHGAADLISMLADARPSEREEPSGDACYAVYLTSGTTGNVKGALVTHNAISQTVREMRNLFPLTGDSTSLSMAPFSVSSERCLNYYYQCSGTTVHYPASMESLIQTIASAKPSIFLTSPLFLEKVKKNITDKVVSNPSSVKDRILSAAVNFAISNRKIKPYSKITSPLHLFFDRLVYRRIRNVLGGRVRYIMSGGASSNPETLRFFWNMGIPVYEGYGMTECHIISVNKPGERNTLSNVGKPFGEAQVKLSAEGEILCKSPYMFSKYLHMEELTASCFTDEGYFRTGDIGTFDNNGFLSVTGRIKTLFKSLSGIYINPEVIEHHLTQSPLISHAIVIGDGKPFLTAIVCAAPGSDLHQVKKAADESIRSFNSLRAEAEQIRKFSVVTELFTVESGELTSNQKLRREIIVKQRAEIISNMYESERR